MFRNSPEGAQPGGANLVQTFFQLTPEYLKHGFPEEPSAFSAHNAHRHGLGPGEALPGLLLCRADLVQTSGPRTAYRIT